MASAPITPISGASQGNAGPAPLTMPPAGQAPHSGGQSPNGSATASSNADSNNTSIHKKGRAKVSVWGDDVWSRIDQAVEHEVKRTRTGKRFLKTTTVPPKTTSVPSDSYVLSTPPNPLLSVDESATTAICEYYVEFEMTPQQVDQEEGDFKTLGHSTAVTLATKAANTLAQAEDTIIFQGQNALNTQSVNGLPVGSTLFTQDYVLSLNGNEPVDTGLLNFAVGTVVPGAGPLTPQGSPQIPVVTVNPLGGAQPYGVIYGANTFTAVADAYSKLQAAGHYGPYALVLHTVPYADTYAPVADLTVTADRIKPLMTAGFFGTGTLPPNSPPVPAAPFYGVMVSLGGNTMDLVVGLEPFCTFMQEDTNGNYRFRVLERFALRIKDPTALVIFQFTAQQ
jgi:uncharacterized linocin/CFP29 family protein